MLKECVPKNEMTIGTSYNNPNIIECTFLLSATSSPIWQHTWFGRDEIAGLVDGVESDWEPHIDAVKQIMNGQLWKTVVAVQEGI